MATGPEHYREAERLDAVAGNGTHSPDERTIAATRALTHAVLAAAAAMGTYGVADETRSPEDASAWENAAGEYTAHKLRQTAHRLRQDAADAVTGADE